VRFEISFSLFKNQILHLKLVVLLKLVIFVIFLSFFSTSISTTSAFLSHHLYIYYKFKGFKYYFLLLKKKLKKDWGGGLGRVVGLRATPRGGPRHLWGGCTPREPPQNKGLRQATPKGGAGHL
jgi:hypothetical protein